MWSVDLEQALPGAPALRWTPRRLLPASDDRLAQMVGSGHEEAFTALYNRYHQRLYRYCRSMLGNDSDAQDALQSTLAGAFAALAQGRRAAPVRPWLYRIAHNESISIMRRRRPEVEITEAHITPAASAAEIAEERSRLAGLMADLAALTERQRAALVMRELGGLSHAEIATALTIDMPAAKQTIFEARRSLQEFAEGRAMVCDEVCQAISAGGGRTLRGRRVRAHLRDCGRCQAFAAAIPARTRDLKAIAPPLAAPAAISILRRAVASTSSHGGAGGAGVAAGTAGKAVGMVTAGKALAGAAAVISVAAGASGVVPSLVHSARPPAQAAGHPARGLIRGQSPGGSVTPPAARAAQAGAGAGAHATETGRPRLTRPHRGGATSATVGAHGQHGARPGLAGGREHPRGQSAGVSRSAPAHGNSSAPRAIGPTRARAGQRTARARSATSPAATAQRSGGSAISRRKIAAAPASHSARRPPASTASRASSGLANVPAALANGAHPESRAH
jgi:RNA polymerase sigma factor (sigma-70 family)